MKFPCLDRGTLSVVLSLQVLAVCRLPAADCNKNARSDEEEIATGDAHDCNGNLVPDECDVGTSIHFATGESYPVGEVPTNLIARDMNGDGLTDLLSLNQLSDTISILLNERGNIFTSGLTLALNSAGALTAADFTGDGLMDIGTYSDFTYQVILFVANRRGTYQQPLEVHKFQDSPDLGDMISADLDGDHDADLAITGGHLNIGYVVSIFLNEGGGSFSGPTSYSCGHQPRALVAFDLDRDEDLDLAAVSFDEGKVTVLQNDGEGKFAAGIDYPVGREPVGIVAADLDGDGFSDLAVVNEKDKSLTLLFNRQDGTFRDEELSMEGGDLSVISAGDLDGDGDPELLAGSGTSIVVLWNEGDGTFPSRKELTIGERTGSIEAVDLDLDGDLDLAVSEWQANKVNVLRNAGNGKFPEPTIRDVGPGPVHPNDWDGDGDQDLAVLTRKGVSFLWREGGTLVKGGLGVGNGGTSSVMAPLDTNGRIDLAVISDSDAPATYTGTFEVVFNRGGEEFEAIQPLELPTVPERIAAGDLDSDGDVDLAVTSSRAGSVFIITNLGDSSFHQEDPLFSDHDPIGVSLSDINSDGKVDLATAESHGGSQGLIQIRPGVGDGTFGDSKRLDVGEEPRDLRVVDLDGDGDLDMVTSNRRSSNVSVVLQASDGSFLNHVKYAVAEDPLSLAVLDADLDGDPDLAVASVEVSTVDIVVNDGKGAFTAGLHLPVSSSPYLVEAIDFNEDGLPDLVTSGFGTGDSGIVAMIPNITVPPSSRDCNHNGVPDQCDIADKTSRDEDGNGVPDECGARPKFHRGDTTADGTMDISDGIFLLGYLFLGESTPACLEAADADNNAEIDVSDSISIFDFLFLGGLPPSSPGPASNPCGQDPDPPGSREDLGCKSYRACN